MTRAQHPTEVELESGLELALHLLSLESSQRWGSNRPGQLGSARPASLDRCERVKLLESDITTPQSASSSTSPTLS